MKCRDAIVRAASASQRLRSEERRKEKRVKKYQSDCKTGRRSKETNAAPKLQKKKKRESASASRAGLESTRADNVLTSLKAQGSHCSLRC